MPTKRSTGLRKYKHTSHVNSLCDPEFEAYIPGIFIFFSPPLIYFLLLFLSQVFFHIRRRQALILTHGVLCVTLYKPYRAHYRTSSYILYLVTCVYSMICASLIIIIFRTAVRLAAQVLIYVLSILYVVHSSNNIKYNIIIIFLYTGPALNTNRSLSSLPSSLYILLCDKQPTDFILQVLNDRGGQL